MFDFLKRKKRLLEQMPILDVEIDFLSRVVGSLPNRYTYLGRQLNREFILGKCVNPLFDDQVAYTFWLDASLESRYIVEGAPKSATLKNIVLSGSRLGVVGFELHLVDGYLASWAFDKKVDVSLVERIDAINLLLKLGPDDESDLTRQLRKRLSRNQLAKLDLTNSYGVEWSGKTYFTIKNLGDGDFLGVDSDGVVYKLTHDSFEIRRIYSSVEDYLKSVE